MLYKKLAQLYEDLSSTPKRLEKIEVLSKFFEYLPEKDSEVLYLLQGEIYPNYDERKIGISSQLTIKAIAKSTGASEKEVVNEWKKIGDLGEVAEKLTKYKTQSTLHSCILTTEKVLENLRKLPPLEGKGTVGKKLMLITELLTSANSLESKYLIRTLIGDLRMGVKESTIREAMSSAFFGRAKEASEKIQEAIDRSNNLSLVFETARRKKLNELEKISLEVGKPIKAMLAQKVTTIKEGFKEVGTPCAIEYKYDGFRLIIHKQGQEVTLFTRMLENVTVQFPEVVGYIKKYVKGNSFILDSEAVGFDKKTKKYTNFQEISQRIRRKYNIEELQEKLPVEINVFDILYYNGKSQMSEPFEERTALIKKILKNQHYKIISAKQIITDNEKKAEEFYKKALGNNQEGIIMKNLQAPYQPGRRVGNMIKLKPEERDLDLVITGAEYGTGKRSGWLTSFILSCRKGSKFLEMGKMSTGVKELEKQGVSYPEMTKILLPLVTKETGKKVAIKPKIVVAVTYQEIQKSPNYNSGFALRFPRFTALRPDKSISEIDTVENIKKEHDKQRRNFIYG